MQDFYLQCKGVWKSRVSTTELEKNLQEEYIEEEENFSFQLKSEADFIQV